MLCRRGATRQVVRLSSIMRRYTEGGFPSFHRSVMGNLPPVLDINDKPIEPTFLKGVEYEPAWKTLAASIQDLLYPKKLPPLELTSKPIAVEDRMAFKRNPRSSAISIGIHALIILCIVAVFLVTRAKMKAKTMQGDRSRRPAIFADCAERAADGRWRWRRLARPAADAQGKIAQARGASDRSADGGGERSSQADARAGHHDAERTFSWRTTTCRTWEIRGPA